MRADLTIIAGLPGSGKSHWIKQHADEFTFRESDFFKHAILNGGDFLNARRYPELIVALRDGRACCIADVQFCRAEKRARAESILSDAVPDLHIRWIAFSNSPEICERNVEHDYQHKGRNLDHRLSTIRELTACYIYPDGAEILEVESAQ